MREQDIGGIISEWLLRRQKRPEEWVGRFAWEKYAESHSEEGADARNFRSVQNIRERETLFYERARAWERNGEAFEKFAGNFQDIPETEPWQSAQMLDNVIAELEMEPEEQYRYLANVKMLLYYRAVRMLDEETGEILKASLEANYEKEWEDARNGIKENELQRMFAETVSLMKYAGIAYDDETRKVLADIGVGRDAEFGGEPAGEMKSDLCFLADFFVSEMVLADAEGQFTEEEQRLIAEQVIPVCVSSASMIREGGDAGHIMKLAQAYLGHIMEGKNGKALAGLAVIFVAARVVYFLIKLAIAGVLIKISLDGLWKYCKNRLGLDREEANQFADFLLAWQRQAGRKAEAEWEIPEEKLWEEAGVEEAGETEDEGEME